MGLRFGRDFISPTGSLFAPRMQVVAFGQPMFDAGRKIEQGVFDYFAQAMQENVLTPKTTAYQQLRLQVAKVASTQALVREALAAAANVSPETDLVAASKAAAVVETLDDIAYGASEAYEEAMMALTSGPPRELQANGMEPEEIQQVLTIRQEHARLWNRLLAGQTTPQEITDELIEYYVGQGCREMDRRFFADGK
jgi:hypothetical protein